MIKETSEKEKKGKKGKRRQCNQETTSQGGENERTATSGAPARFARGSSSPSKALAKAMMRGRRTREDFIAADNDTSIESVYRFLDRKSSDEMEYRV